MSESTAIVLTPPGGAAIAVVRLSGPLVGEFLAAHFSKTARPGRCVHGELRDGARVIDDPVVVVSAHQTHVDINLHGGPWVIQSTLDLAGRFGFIVGGQCERPLSAGQYDARDAIEGEMLAHLPLATTELGLRELLRQPEAWRRFDLLDDRAQRMAAKEMVADRGLWWLLHPPSVALVGAANVGKSTLANQLFGQETSITADLPGTTRDWVGEMANLDGLPILLIDTPGIRESMDPIERIAIEHAGTTIQRADVVVLILDASQPLEPDQAPLMTRFPQALKVINKCDLPAAWDISTQDAIQSTATRAVGMDELRKRIREAFGVDSEQTGESARWWTREQQSRLDQLAR